VCAPKPKYSRINAQTFFTAVMGFIFNQQKYFLFLYTQQHTKYGFSKTWLYFGNMNIIDARKKCTYLSYAFWCRHGHVQYLQPHGSAYLRPGKLGMLLPGMVWLASGAPKGVHPGLLLPFIAQVWPTLAQILAPYLLRGRPTIHNHLLDRTVQVTALRHKESKNGVHSRTS
jgi:hypothetical protein